MLQQSPESYAAEYVCMSKQRIRIGPEIRACEIGKRVPLLATAKPIMSWSTATNSDRNNPGAKSWPYDLGDMKVLIKLSICMILHDQLLMRKPGGMKL